MRIPFAGFTGPTYALQNKYAAVERLINWYVAPNESSDEGKWQLSLAPSPANVAFSELPVPAPFNQPCRGLLELRGSVFGVNGTVVFYLLPGGGMLSLGAIENDGKPVRMVANGNGQIFIASAGKGYSIITGVLQAITTDQFFGASDATFQDGYIIVLTPGAQTVAGSPAKTNQFQISGDVLTPLGDAKVWDAANIAVLAGQQDNLVAIISSREYLRIMGARRSQIFYNAGNSGQGGFPFISYNETFIETGCAATYSVADMGDSLIWLGEDARGQRACWRDAAFQPQRISNFSVEQAWQSYARVDDAVAFPFIWRGHLQYQVTFPTANKTWVYDATTSQLIGKPTWSERNYTDAHGQQMARSEQFHCFGYGRHLVGSTGIDGNPGAVYQYDDTVDYDCGTDIGGAQVQQQIVSDRVCPHIWKNEKRLVIWRIGFTMVLGAGSDGTGPDPNPQLLLRWSKDGGNTFGPEYNMPVGELGNYKELVYMNRLGYARDFVFWLRATGGARRGIVAAELDVSEMSS